MPELLYIYLLHSDEEGTGGRRDFNNTVLNFTITAGNDAFDVDISTLISEDEVNEAAEQFILVLEADSNEVEFDAQEGILVVTILDNNGKTNKFTFSMEVVIFFRNLKENCL